MGSPDVLYVFFGDPCGSTLRPAVIKEVLLRPGLSLLNLQPDPPCRF